MLGVSEEPGDTDEGEFEGEGRGTVAGCAELMVIGCSFPGQKS